MELKFACREYMVPGNSITERFEAAARLGLAGIEVTGSSTREHLAEIKAAIAATEVRASFMSSQSLAVLDARRDERMKAIAAFKEALSLAGEVGAVGVILPPLISVKCLNGERIPDLSPYMTTAEIEQELLTVILKDLAAHAVACGADVVIEPLNRYEQWWPCTLQHGVDICEALGRPGVSIMADFFHMNIEDACFGESIRKAGALVRNVHLADSQRSMPGYGHTDFRPGFAALKQIGYGDYLSFECGVPGDPFVEFPKAMAYVRGEWEAA
jgi:sugar phosphate isomerase/epimerase